MRVRLELGDRLATEPDDEDRPDDPGGDNHGCRRNAAAARSGQQHRAARDGDPHHHERCDRCPARHPGTGLQRTDDLEPQLELLKKIGDTLGVLGLGGIREQVQAEAARLKGLLGKDRGEAEDELARHHDRLVSNPRMARQVRASERLSDLPAVRERAAQDGSPLCFIGAGAYEQHIPAAVWDDGC